MSIAKKIDIFCMFFMFRPQFEIFLHVCHLKLYQIENVKINDFVDEITMRASGHLNCSIKIKEHQDKMLF